MMVSMLAGSQEECPIITHKIAIPFIISISVLRFFITFLLLALCIHTYISASIYDGTRIMRTHTKGKK